MTWGRGFLSARAGPAGRPPSPGHFSPSLCFSRVPSSDSVPGDPTTPPTHRLRHAGFPVFIQAAGQVTAKGSRTRGLPQGEQRGSPLCGCSPYQLPAPQRARGGRACPEQRERPASPLTGCLPARRSTSNASLAYRMEGKAKRILCRRAILYINP